MAISHTSSRLLRESSWGSRSCPNDSLNKQNEDGCLTRAHQAKQPSSPPTPGIYTCSRKVEVNDEIRNKICSKNIGLLSAR